MYFEGKADAGDFGPRIAKVNKTGDRMGVVYSEMVPFRTEG